MAEYEIPPHLDGILTTFALTLAPEYDAVIAKAAKALSPGGRFVILDLKLPDKYRSWLVKLAVLITKPFGVTLAMEQRHPWESAHRYFAKTTYDELYGGFAYICVGQVAG